MRSIIVAFLFAGSVAAAEDKVVDPFASAPGHATTGQPAVPMPPEDFRPRPDTLKLLREPSLEKLSDAERFPSIRFLWVRTFHSPISFRAYMTKDGPRFRVARTSGKGGYDWGTLDFEKDFPLKNEVWLRILKLLQADGARQPFKNVKPGARDFLSGMDGATWTLEVVDKSGYTVDSVWSPTIVTNSEPEKKKLFEDQGIRLDNFVELCLFLIQCAPIDPGSIY